MLDVAWKGASCYGAALPETGREDATHGRARRRTRTDHTRRLTCQARGRGEPAAGACARPFCYGRRGCCCGGGRRARLLGAWPRRGYEGGHARGDGTVLRPRRGTELLRESTERRRHKERDRGRTLHPAQRPHRHRGPGRPDRVERGSTLGQPGGRSALRTRQRNGVLSHPLYDGISNKVPINIGVVRAGSWASTVPESLVAEGRVGLIPGEEVDPFKDLVSERIATVAERDPWLREHPPELEWFGGQFAPAEVEPNAPICEAVKKAHERVTGETPAVEGVAYGADMRIFIHFGGIPCVMYGAGDVNVAHAPDEHISITELLTATTTVACLLLDWCGVEED